MPKPISPRGAAKGEAAEGPVPEPNSPRGAATVLGVVLSVISPIVMARDMPLSTSLRGSLGKKACSVAAAASGLFSPCHTTWAKLQACRYPLAHILPRVRAGMMTSVVHLCSA